MFEKPYGESHLKEWENVNEKMGRKENGLLAYLQKESSRALHKDHPLAAG